MVDVGTETIYIVLFQEFFDGFLGGFAVLAEDAAEIGLEEDAEIVEALEDLEVFLGGAITLGVGKDDVIAEFD